MTTFIVSPLHKDPWLMHQDREGNKEWDEATAIGDGAPNVLPRHRPFLFSKQQQTCSSLPTRAAQSNIDVEELVKVKRYLYDDYVCLITAP